MSYKNFIETVDGLVAKALSCDMAYVEMYESCGLAEECGFYLRDVWDHKDHFTKHWEESFVRYTSYAVWRAVYNTEHFERHNSKGKKGGPEVLADKVTKDFLEEIPFMKEYILIKDKVPLGFAMAACAHGPLIAHLEFSKGDDYKYWLEESFRKVVCKVSQKEFLKAKKEERNIVVTESALDGEEVALVFEPRREWPDYFKRFQLYS